ncbi:MAG: hypothetical protein FRX49_10757 [Trebouxia sp. A1-2]|nr:MAG: hypothetical protein FRX49_10757 [Trebouxia sp. A1-2]
MEKCMAGKVASGRERGGIRGRGRAGVAVGVEEHEQEYVERRRTGGNTGRQTDDTPILMAFKDRSTHISSYWGSNSMAHGHMHRRKGRSSLPAPAAKSKTRQSLSSAIMALTESLMAVAQAD